MKPASREMTTWRLSAQQLYQPQWRQPERVVRWLGGVQAQNPAWALWSIGLRLRDGSASKVQHAIEERHIVRTWAFRGTLHYVAAADLSWLIPLLAPTIIARNTRRYRQLELDETTFAQSNRVIHEALEPGEPLLRAEIARALERSGISAKGQRIHYLVQRAALDGLICHGLPRGKEPAYSLVSQWIQPGQAQGLPLQQDVTGRLAALAERYFSSHGPATVQDFAWWSGLPVAIARQALGAAQSLVQIKAEGKALWAGQEQPVPSMPQAAYLLPPYDDYLLGYKDRSWALDPAYAKRVNAGGGMPKATIVVNGEVVGTWTRTIKDNRAIVRLKLFRSLDEPENQAIEKAAHRYSSFSRLALNILP